MSVPLLQQFRVGSYILGQKLKGNKKYPLVLMLEPLFKCNLACAGCGKIDYPKAILDKRLSYEECMQLRRMWFSNDIDCGGEPLIHKEMKNSRGFIQRKKFIYLCTNALLLDRKMDEYQPSLT